MPTLVVDQRVVSYEDRGSGPLVVLLHGSPGNARAWARVGERLAAQHRVVAPDLPGYGGTTPQPRDQQPDVGFASELVAALIAHVGAPAVLAAHSYGGVVALRTALRGAPVGALALFEPVAMTLLPVAGEPEAFATTRSVFDDYFATHDAGDPRAVRKMIDFWFGDGAFARMPDALDRVPDPADGRQHPRRARGIPRGLLARGAAASCGFP
jgi:pimeloyl-ACP methyl ester carboxylesterase